MYRALLKDASLYSMSSVLASGISLITVPIFTRFLSPSDYGALDLLSYLAVFLPLIFGLALDQAVARYFVGSNDRLEKEKIASTVLIYTVFGLLPAVLCVIPMAGYLSESWLNGQVDDKTVVLVAAFVWISAIFSIATNQLRYLFLAKKYAACNIVNTVVSMSLSVMFVAVFGMGVFGVFLAQTISKCLMAIVAIYFGREHYRLIFSAKLFVSMCKYSLPLVPSTVAFMGMQYADRLMLNELKTLHDVGLYGIGARLASLLSLFLVGFQGAWHPIVMKSYDEDGIREKFERVFMYFLYVTCVIMVGVSLFSEEILRLLTTEEFSKGYIVVPLLISSAIVASIGNYFTYGIQIEKRSALRLYINFGGLSLNVLLNVFLIQAMGIMGAALATFVSFVAMATVGMMVSQRLYHVGYRWRRVLAVLLFAITAAHTNMILSMGISLMDEVAKILVLVAAAYVIGRILETNPLQVIKTAMSK